MQAVNPADYRRVETTALNISVVATELCISPPPPKTRAEPASMLPKGADSRLKSRTSPKEPCDLAFTKTLLDGGAGYRSDYETVRLASTFERDGTPTRVDIHELFWADLSHGGVTNSFAVFGQLMQFFLHMASLGRTTLVSMLETMSEPEKKSAKMESIYDASALGYWLLAVPILIGNILFVMFGLLTLTLLIPDDAPAKLGASIAGGAFAAVAVAWLARRKLRSPSTAPSLAKAGVFGAAAAGAAAFVALKSLPWDSVMPPRNLLFALEAALLVVIGTALMRMYDKSRPRALTWWYGVLGLVAAWGLACAVSIQFTIEAHPAQRFDYLLRWFDYLVEGCFVALVAAWGVLYLVNLVLLALSVRAKQVSPPIAADARQAIDTSLLAASIPAPLFISVILFLWIGVASMLSRSQFERLAQPVSSLFFGDNTILSLMERLISLSASPAFLPYLASLLLAFFCAVIGVAPSIIAELAPPKPPHADAPSYSLGNWLDGGFRIMRFSGLVALVGFFILLPGGAIVQYADLYKFADNGALGSWPAGSVVAVGGSAVAFLAASKFFAGASLRSFSRFFMRLRVVVDTAIDVDNWLRERPFGATPRLRIMARYASLLSHLADQGYGKIVIVAHSQGTVVTADMFRYLKARNPALLERLKDTTLLTLGCPLRQLYARRFPALYGWAQNAPTDQSGFATWINGYGSGDYVGRYLWHATGSPDCWKPGRAPGQREFCVGAIAHTHYFGDYAPDVRAALNELIA
ncbi:MAG: hypothetical protein H7Z39_07715 [Burkholderiaceae bacterium]|nr:hypothetical protein [Burkholderiaceae bacterium]